MELNFYKKGLHVFIVGLIVAVIFSIMSPVMVYANEDVISKPQITCRAHVQKEGWMNWVETGSNEALVKEPADGMFVGTRWQAKRMEALQIVVPEGITLKYRAHVQKEGWMDWVDAQKNQVSGEPTEGTYAGTMYQAKRMEALQIAVEGIPEGYELRYRAHVQKEGWMDWVKAIDVATIGNGEPAEGTYAGTMYQSKRMEAFQIVLVNLLDEAKQKAIETLNGYHNPEDYSFSAEAYNNAITEGEKIIKDATSFEDVQSALEAAKAKVDAIPNNTKVLIDVKNQAMEDLVNYINELMPQCEKNGDALEAELVNALDALDKATTPEEVAKVIEDAKVAMDAIETDTEIAEREAAEKALREAKSNAINKFQDAWIQKVNSGTFDFDALEEMLNSWCDAIENAETIEVVEQTLADANAALEAIKSDEQIFSEAKELGTATLKDTYDSIKKDSRIQDEDNKNTPLQTSLKEKIEAAKAEAEKVLNEATTPEEIEVAVKKATETMEQAKAIFDMQKAGSDEIQVYWLDLQEQYPNKDGEDKLQQFGPILSDAIDAINKAATPEEVETVVKEAKEKMDKVVLPDIKDNAKNEINENVTALKEKTDKAGSDPLKNATNKKIDEIKTTVDATITAAETKEEVEEATDAAMKALEDVETVFNAKKDAISDLQNYWNDLLKAHPASASDLVNAFAEGVLTIADLEDTEAVQQALEQAKVKMNIIVE